MASNQAEKVTTLPLLSAERQIVVRYDDDDDDDDDNE